MYPANAPRVDGIRDYTERVADQLHADGCEAEMLQPPLGRGLPASLLTALPKGERTALVVQYNPFSWGRRGVAPALVLALAIVRWRRPRVRVLLVIHEGYVPRRNLRWFLMGTWQRAQLRVLLALSHGAVATTGYLKDELSRGWPRRAISHVPVGSNLPDERASRETARATAGFDGRLVIATFGTGHESHMHSLVARTAEAVATSLPEPVVLLLLGSGNQAPFEVSAIERSVRPGYLEARALAQAMSSADIFLGPFSDGATTHRTTLMAALQHGVAAVCTASARTEPMLMGDALLLAPPDDAAGFVAQAVRLGRDRRLRERYGGDGRALYDRCFSWSAVCAGLRVAVDATFDA